ncbi:hypothetical protein ACUOCP_53900, partial [Escherichia sp. R-CC3]
YNKLNPDKQKPYILLAIDEVAMLQDEKECMTTIEKISAVGRALGVFLMLSMQRPDAKVQLFASLYLILNMELALSLIHLTLKSF